MAAEINLFGQPIGPLVTGWEGARLPEARMLEGWGCRCEPLDPAHHEAGLWQAFGEDDGQLWTYLPSGPFPSRAEWQQWLAQAATGQDPAFYAIVDATTGRALGLASLLRIDPMAGSIEVGWLLFAPAMRRTRLATAAMTLMMAYAFELGYRRYEWKCNALNLPSRQAALRLGFTFEGIFRQARVDKGRSRDTAWFSVIDSEWPALQAVLTRWLDETNFDMQGRQRLALSHLTAALRGH